MFDGVRDIFTDVVLRLEDPGSGGSAEPFLYGAANRAGMVKLALSFTPDVNPAGYRVDFSPVALVNTPGQATGVCIRTGTDPLGCKDRSILTDHGDCGVEVFGEY